MKQVVISRTTIVLPLGVSRRDGPCRAATNRIAQDAQGAECLDSRIERGPGDRTVNRAEMSR
jgi:hypothetical protein